MRVRRWRHHSTLCAKFGDVALFDTTGRPRLGPHSLIRCAKSRLCPRVLIQAGQSARRRRRRRRLRWPRARRRLPPRCAIRPGTSPITLTLSLARCGRRRQPRPQIQPQPQPPPHQAEPCAPKPEARLHLDPRPGGEAPARASPRAADHGERTTDGRKAEGQRRRRLRALEAEEHHHWPSVWPPRPSRAQGHSPSGRCQHAGRPQVHVATPVSSVAPELTHAPLPAQVTRSIGDWDAVRLRTLHLPTPTPRCEPRPLP